MKKLKFNILLVCIILISIPSIYAERNRGKSSRDIFMKMMDIINKNTGELKITENQIKEIKPIELNYQKDKIKYESAIEIVSLDIEAILDDDKIDMKTLNELIDRKYENKISKTKAMFKAFVELKKILTYKQKELIQKIMKKERLEKKEGNKKGCKCRKGNKEKGCGECEGKNISGEKINEELKIRK